MSIYLKLYENLCQTRKENRNNYGPFSGLHCHHIKPKHSGGTNEEENLTYLTPREHKIAHFLLWKIYKNPNDLRSMKMLGVELSTAYRRIVGGWCRDNKIGFHSDKYTKDERLEWARRGLDAQKNSTDKNTFYYWSTEEGRKHRASLGGKASWIANKDNSTGIHALSKEEKSKIASLGGKACGKIPMWTNGIINKRSYECPGEGFFKGMLTTDPITKEKVLRVFTKTRKRKKNL